MVREWIPCHGSPKLSKVIFKEVLTSCPRGAYIENGQLGGPFFGFEFQFFLYRNDIENLESKP